jgi:hypothetical protein
MIPVEEEACAGDHTEVHPVDAGDEGWNHQDGRHDRQHVDRGVQPIGLHAVRQPDDLLNLVRDVANGLEGPSRLSTQILEPGADPAILQVEERTGDELVQFIRREECPPDLPHQPPYAQRLLPDGLRLPFAFGTVVLSLFVRPRLPHEALGPSATWRRGQGS